MTTLQDIRTQYPQYGDMSDKDLADKLHQRFYSDMPREQFNARVGLPEATTAETVVDVGMEGTAGINRGVDSFLNFVGMPARAAFNALGANIPEARILSRANVERTPETRAGRFAGSMGEALGSSVVPSAAVLQQANRLRLAAPSLPSLSESLLRPVAAAPTAATTIDVAASLGAGGAQEAAREGGGGPIAQTAASLAGGVVPVVGATSAARTMARAGEAGAQRFGIRASADGAEPVIPPRAQDRADQMLADTLTRAGVSADDIRRTLGGVQEARTLGPGSRAADATALVDLDPSLQRLAGSVARQSTEAANHARTFMRARHTGVTPSVGTLHPAHGIPTRPELSPPVTGAQAMRAHGTSYGTPDDRLVPMGQLERLKDALKRSLRIRDEDHHGHGANAYRTEQGMIAGAKNEAKNLYGETYAAGRGVDLTGPLTPVFRQWAERSKSEPQPVEAALRRAMRLFFTREGALVTDIQRFDKAKQYLDGQIEKLFQSVEGRNRYLGGILNEMKNDLLRVVDTITTSDMGSKYKAARGAFSSQMEAREALEFGRSAFRGDPNVTADGFAAMTEGQQKLARLGYFGEAEQAMSGLQRNADATRIFSTPRQQEVLQIMIPRSERGSAAFHNRPERFGKYIEGERQMIETRDVVRGGSPTARNLADDEAFEVLNSVVEQFKNNPSTWTFGKLAVDYAISKAFGMRADTAKALGEMLFTADPTRRGEIIQRVAQRMGPERMLRFSQILQEAQQSGAASIFASTGNLASGAAAATQQ